MLKKHTFYSCHRPILDSFDFWAIVPNEGKFEMSKQFSRTRMLARVFVILLLNKDGAI